MLRLLVGRREEQRESRVRVLHTLLVCVRELGLRWVPSAAPNKKKLSIMTRTKKERENLPNTASKVGKVETSWSALVVSGRRWMVVARTSVASLQCGPFRHEHNTPNHATVYGCSRVSSRLPRIDHVIEVVSGKTTVCGIHTRISVMGQTNCDDRGAGEPSSARGGRFPSVPRGC